MNRYSDNAWNQLPTSLSNDDDNYLYMTAQTPGFSPFAITGKTTSTGAIQPAAVDKTQTAILNETQNRPNIVRTAANIEQTREQAKSPNTSGKESTKMPGFEITLNIICLICIFMYKRK